MIEGPCYLSVRGWHFGSRLEAKAVLLNPHQPDTDKQRWRWEVLDADSLRTLFYGTKELAFGDMITFLAEQAWGKVGDAPDA